MRVGPVAASIAVLVVLGGASGGRAQQLYVIKDLGTLGGTYSAALAINASGDIVGGSALAGGNSANGAHGFLYRQGVMSDLGVPFGFQSFAYGINTSGQIVLASTDGLHNHVFLYGNGNTVDTGLTQAYSINDLGQVAGSGPSGTTSHIFIYDSGGLHDLGFGGLAYGINNSGQVVGLFGVPMGSTTATHPFLYSNGSARDLGTLGGTYGVAAAINDKGQVVGSAELPPLTTGDQTGPRHAFVYSNGKMTDLDPLGGASGSAAGDINSVGDVVGARYFGQQPHAMLWRAGQMIDLNSVSINPSGLLLSSAVGINDSGWIVGAGFTPSGDEHAFLAIPTPEPSGASLALLSATFLLRRRRAGRW